MGEKMYCSNCGKELPTATNFCSHCGVKLGVDSQVTQDITLKNGSSFFQSFFDSAEQIVSSVTKEISDPSNLKFVTETTKQVATTAFDETLTLGKEVMKSETVKDAVAGAVAGAIAGSVIPLVGTEIGAAVGAGLSLYKNTVK
jgi:hypothetical protein